MDFSLTTLFVVPSSQSTLPTTGSTQNLTAGQFGIFDNAYATTATGTIATKPYIKAVVILTFKPLSVLIKFLRLVL
jgi:hypothetical protein